MGKFKVGDKVKRIGINSFTNKVIVGEIYTVSSVNDFTNKITLEEVGFNHTFLSSKFELVEPEQFKRMKFYTKTEEERIFIQNYLFDLGYKWRGYKARGDDGQQIMKFVVGAIIIFTYDDGIITWSDNDLDTDVQKHEPYELEAVTTFTLKKLKPQTIEINGVTYLQSEYEAALKSLTPYKGE